MGYGSINICRSFFDHFLWEEEREYSKAEAWVDLVRSASFKDRTQVFKGLTIKLKRGELIASQRFLCTRWNWSRSKVRSYLELLGKEGMISVRKTQGQTVLNLCNYNKFNKSYSKEKTQQSPTVAQEQPTVAQVGPKENKSNLSNSFSINSNSIELEADKNPPANSSPKIETEKPPPKNRGSGKRKKVAPKKENEQWELMEVMNAKREELFPGCGKITSKKQFSHIKLLNNQFRAKIAAKEKIPSSQVEFDKVKAAFEIFVNEVPLLGDSWIVKNFVPSILNSKFDELIGQIIDKRNGGKSASSKKGATSLVSEETANTVFKNLMEKDRQRAAC